MDLAKPNHRPTGGRGERGGAAWPSTQCAQSDTDHVEAHVMERGAAITVLWLRCHAGPTSVLESQQDDSHDDSDEDSFENIKFQVF